jgi:2,3-bisphosphoglycerate-independent phosphoglycerate mutase
VAEIQMPSAKITAPKPTPIYRDHTWPLKGHSSHNPLLIHGAAVRPDPVREFGERACLAGTWGVIPGAMLMRLALAYSGKLAKYGA